MLKLMGKKIFTILPFNFIWFQIAYVQQCGSMAEKTSLWKSVQIQGAETKFIEFDYMAILKEQNYKCVVNKSCRGCARLKVVEPSERIPASSPLQTLPLRPAQFDLLFHETLFTSLLSYCTCCSFAKCNKKAGLRSGYTLVYDPTANIGDNACSRCSVVKNTGYLRVAQSTDSWIFSKKQGVSSIMFIWKSTAKSIAAPNIDTLEMTDLMDQLLVCVDFLPVFETDITIQEQHCFLVPKRCPLRCFKTWRLSYCMAEVDVIRHKATEHHRKCYIFLKYLFGHFKYCVGEYVNSYHGKVAFLNHCSTCSNINADMTDCVLSILHSLQHAYRIRSIKAPVSDIHFNPNKSNSNSVDPFPCFLQVLTEIQRSQENFEESSAIKAEECINILNTYFKQMMQHSTEINNIAGKHYTYDVIFIG